MQLESPFLVAPGPALDLVATTHDVAATTSRLYHRDGWSVIEITGELDIQGVPSVRRLRLRAGPRVLFDLRGVTFIDCSGLRAISGPDAFGRPSCVFVCGTTGRARLLLELFGADWGLSFYASVDEALQARV